MTVTAVVLPERARLAALTAYVKMLADGGESVVLVTFHDPAPVLKALLERAEVDLRHVVLIDALGDGPDREQHTGIHLMAAPTLLELVALRVQRIAKAHERPHVVISDCEGLSFHNEAKTVEEYLRYIVHHVAKPRLPFDFVRAEPSHLDLLVKDAVHRLIPNEKRIPPSLAAA